LFRKGIIVIVILLFPVLCLSQASREKKALKFIRQQRYNSAYVLLKKSLAKDSLNIGAQYVLGQYYTIPKNIDFHLDSAYLYAARALHTWEYLPEKSRKKWAKLPLDSDKLLELRQQIEGLAFAEAEQLNSEESYSRYLASFPLAKERPAAIQLRNQVAFAKAQKENTYSAFHSYMERYPDSKYAREAQLQYDRLLFEERTREKSLASYREFLKAYPDSPYRKEAEKNILEIMTADGSAEVFIKFLTEFPRSNYHKIASGILFHILLEDHRENLFPALFETDSALKIESTQTNFLVPFMQNGKFGLMNQAGKQILAPVFTDLQEEYLCGNITEDVIILPGQLVSKSGALIWRGNLKSLDDLGYGYTLIDEGKSKSVLHKSGFHFPEKNLQDAKLLQGRMLAAKQNNKWGLFTLTGRKLIDYNCQDISAMGSVFVLQINDKYALSTLSSLASIANAEKGRFTEVFDEVKKLAGDKIWIRLGEFEGVLSQDLQVLIKMDTHRVSPAYFGAIGISAHGYSTFNEFGEESEYFQNLQVINPWIVAKNKLGWMLYDPQQRIAKSIVYDSVAVYGPFAIGVKKDGLEIHLHKNNSSLIIPLADKIEFLPGNDSVSYLLVEKGKKRDVYNPSGQKLFTVTYDKIQSTGDGLFIVSMKEKKGLIDSKGKLILPMEYDAIGTATHGMVSILKNAKFGLFDYRKHKLIKPEYEKNITLYSPKVFSVFKNGFSGFIDINNQVLGKIEFTDVEHWTDSIALVRKNDAWSLYDIFRKKPIMENISEFKVIRNTPAEKLFIIRQDNLSGVISNRKGIVIPITFSDIVNVGSAEIPVYFTEKHVQEASIFVVIYYDHKGTLLRKEVFEQEDYEKIYCNKSDSQNP
jgi:hypothetical protein